MLLVIIEAAVEPINVCPSVATHKGKRLPRRARILPLRLPLTSQLRIADSSPVRLAANPSGQNLRHGRCLAWPQISADHQRLEALRCCPRPRQQPQHESIPVPLMRTRQRSAYTSKAHGHPLKWEVHT